MEMSGSRRIAARRETVWAALNDPDILGRCIPGCEHLEKTSDTSFTATAKAAIGPVKAKFKGDVTLSEIDPPNGYRLTGQGSGGAAGFARGSARVALADVADGTELTYTVEANVGGKLAQIGARLIDGAAKKMADDFFARFS
ncbi:MAG: carbon monoxide dehydrogenase, partial [Alphaproteobacteria bacterium]